MRKNNQKVETMRDSTTKARLFFLFKVNYKDQKKLGFQKKVQTGVSARVSFLKLLQFYFQNKEISAN
jgi:hypothetical protein